MNDETKHNETLDSKAICILIEDFSEFLMKRIADLKVGQIREDLHIFIELLIRFRYNLNSCILILPNFENDIEYKFPLSLILRSINSDVLTSYYLNSFITPDNDDLNGLKNEMKVLYKDYVRFIKEFGKEELELTKEISPQREKYINQLETIINNHYNTYSEYYNKNNGNKKLISNSELRKTTPTDFFPEPNLLNEPSGFMSEKYKYERIKKNSQGKYCGQAYLAFKYYSQFQHISPATIELLYLNPAQIDNKFFLMTLENVFISTNLILKNLLNNGFKDDISMYIEKLKKNILKMIDL